MQLNLESRMTIAKRIEYLDQETEIIESKLAEGGEDETEGVQMEVVLKTRLLEILEDKLKCSEQLNTLESDWITHRMDEVYDEINGRKEEVQAAVSTQEKQKLRKAEAFKTKWLNDYMKSEEEIKSLQKHNIEMRAKLESSEEELVDKKAI